MIAPLLLAAALVSSTPRPAAQGLTGFYVPWDAAGRQSLAGHIDALAVFSPQWIELVSAEGAITVESDAEAEALLAKAPRRPAVMPLVSNAHDDIWDSKAANAVILDPARRRPFLDRLARLAASRRFAGYVFDFEDISPRAVAAYPAFLADAHARLSAKGVEVWVTTPFNDPSWPLAAMQASGATVVLMAYDQCWAGSTPGPIAGQDWFEATLPRVFKGLKPSKTILALGAYAYDWPQDARAAVVSSGQAAATAAKARAAVTRPSPSLNPTYSYVAADGRRHTVWSLDGAAFARQKAAADAYHPRGYAIWRLGLEDPGLWAARALPPSAIGAAAEPPAVCTPLPAKP